MVHFEDLTPRRRAILQLIWEKDETLDHAQITAALPRAVLGEYPPDRAKSDIIREELDCLTRKSLLDHTGSRWFLTSLAKRALYDSGAMRHLPVAKGRECPFCGSDRPFTERTRTVRSNHHQIQCQDCGRRFIAVPA